MKDERIEEIIIQHFGSETSTATVSLSQAVNMVKQALAEERERIARWLDCQADGLQETKGGKDIAILHRELAADVRRFK